VVLPRSPSYEPGPPAQRIRMGKSLLRDELQEEPFLGCNRDRIAQLPLYRTHMPRAAVFQAQASGCQLRACIPCVKHRKHAACGLRNPHKSVGRGHSELELRASVQTSGYRPNAQVLMDIFAHTAGSYHYASCVSVKLQGRVSFAS
jgi:hypothetical protein